MEKRKRINNCFGSKECKMESRDEQGKRLSSASQRQSSEFYPSESTINYIWQVFALMNSLVTFNCESYLSHFARVFHTYLGEKINIAIWNL